MPKNSDRKIYFEDRKDAAGQLFDSLPADLFQDRDNLLIVALSTGGVLVADDIAKRLECDMDILISEDILAPKNRELSIAKVSEVQEIVIHTELINSFGIDEDLVYDEAKRVYTDKIIPYIYKYRKGEPIQSMEGKVVLLIDECVETDLTVMVAIKSMIAMDVKNVYVATPILDKTAYSSLLNISDGVFAPHQIRDYISIEYYYRNLDRPESSQIERILENYE